MPSASASELPLLLDTHYLLWYQFGIRERLTDASLRMIRAAADRNSLFLSIMSVWEIGMLESKARIQLYKSCAQWVEEALSAPGLNLIPLTLRIAIDSSRLPGDFHGDPADRVIVATARSLGARLLTSDKSIQAYASQLHVLLA
ncbi:MAG TPA: type II toxin-antitoxin system VapC family toxin [Bryobacteraceae bacterium]|nr:type II toxin-antitoxin system VapC family toxin [Bryobacteraceae bacterium]